jgi:hypothetical protein
MNNNQISKYENAFVNLSSIFKSEEKYEKYKYAFQIRNAGLKRLEAAKIGFNFSSYMWKRCKFYGPRKNFGRKAIKFLLRQKIETHMKSISSIAANRYLKKCESNAYYSSVPLVQAYNSFKYKDYLSFSSFYKYVSDKFKKPHRFSDLCDYCEINKVFNKY